MSTNEPDSSGASELMKKYECGHISISKDGQHSHQCPSCRPDTSMSEGDKDEFFQALKDDDTFLRLSSEGIVWYIDRESVDKYQFVNPENGALDAGDMDKVRKAMDVYSDVTLVERPELPEEVADVF